VPVTHQADRLGSSDPGAVNIWLPCAGEVLVKFPPGKRRAGVKVWLTRTLGIRSPVLDEDGYWRLPRGGATRLLRASIDRFGVVDIYRDMAALTRCHKSCQDATGAECQCSCFGEHHGENSNLWYQRRGDVLVADLGDFKRTRTRYGPVEVPGGFRLYESELVGRRYTVKPVIRSFHAWPLAGEFACMACITTRAEVWDHCHTHGFVRGPLCNRCNTRTWDGWSPEAGRTRAESNVDGSYYQQCPGYSTGRCSA
jgi:Recombination endonuclease VII